MFFYIQLFAIHDLQYYLDFVLKLFFEGHFLSFCVFGSQVTLQPLWFFQIVSACLFERFDSSCHAMELLFLAFSFCEFFGIECLDFLFSFYFGDWSMFRLQKFSVKNIHNIVDQFLRFFLSHIRFFVADFGQFDGERKELFAFQVGLFS